jgi:hypothetical protein
MASLFIGKIHVALKPLRMLFVVSAFRNAKDTQCTSVVFVAGWSKFHEVQKSLYSRKCCLNGLNIATSRGCSACDVWNGSVSKSSPVDLASWTTSNVTWLLWPSNMSRCRWSGETPPSRLTDSIKCEIHALKRYNVIHARGCIAIVALASQC